MNKLLLLCVFFHLISCTKLTTPVTLVTMQKITPGDVIKDYVTDIESVFRELKKFSSAELKNYRDENYNNLLHILMMELIIHKNKVYDFKQLLENSKTLFYYLISIGLNINEVNDYHETPYSIACCDRDTQNFAEDFLRFYLKAVRSVSSLSPELRAIKKSLKYICCCDCLKDIKYE